MSDLAALFAQDPLTYSKQDLETIVTEFRSKRKQFLAGSITAGKTKPPSKKESQVAQIVESLATSNLDLSL